MPITILTREEFEKRCAGNETVFREALRGFAESADREDESFARSYTQTTPSRSLAAPGYGWRSSELEPFEMPSEWKRFGYTA